MLISIDLESDIPIYQQLRDRIVYGMATGALADGESLPSVRQFAADLGINMHTVNKAYNMLKSEGLIAIHKRRGVIVKKPQNADQAGRGEFLQKLNEKLEPLVAEAVCRMVGRGEMQGILEGILEKIEKGE